MRLGFENGMRKLQVRHCNSAVSWCYHAEFQGYIYSFKVSNVYQIPGMSSGVCFMFYGTSIVMIHK